LLEKLLRVNNFVIDDARCVSSSDLAPPVVTNLGPGEGCECRT